MSSPELNPGVQYVNHYFPQVVNGWYYLLAEEVGRYKHLQAVTKRTSQEGRSSDRLVSSVNQDIRWMDSHVVSQNFSNPDHWNIQSFQSENTFENYVCKMSTIFQGVQL